MSGSKNYSASRSVRSIIGCVISIAGLDEISSSSSSNAAQSQSVASVASTLLSLLPLASTSNDNNNNVQSQNYQRQRRSSTPGATPHLSASSAPSQTPALLDSSSFEYDPVVESVEQDARTLALVYVAKRYFHHHHHHSQHNADEDENRNISINNNSNIKSTKKNHSHLLLEDLMDSLCNSIQDSLDPTNVETNRSNMTEERRNRKIAVSLAILNKIFSTVFMSSPSTVTTKQQPSTSSSTTATSNLSLGFILDKIFAILLQTALSSSSSAVCEFSFRLFQSIVLFSSPSTSDALAFAVNTKSLPSCTANIPIFLFRALFPLAKSKAAPLQRRERALSTLTEIIETDPHVLLDLFLKYDCQEHQQYNVVQEILKEAVGIYFSFAHPDVVAEAQRSSGGDDSASQNISRSTSNVSSTSAGRDTGGTGGVDHQTQFSSLKHIALSIFISFSSSIRVWLEKFVEEEEQLQKQQEQKSAAPTFNKNVNIATPIVAKNNALLFEREESATMKTPSFANNNNTKKQQNMLACEKFNSQKFEEAFDLIENAKLNNKQAAGASPPQSTTSQADATLPYDASVIAAFLHKENHFINKLTLGDFLSKKKPLNRAILESFVRCFNFSRLFVDEALRLFLSTFKICGEAQVVDTTMELFASQYIIHNREAERNGGIKNASCAFVLAFSICMLNTDAHSPNVTTRMPFSVFLERVRLLEDSAEVPEIFLRGIYDRIVAHEITLRLGPNDPKPDDEQQQQQQQQKNRATGSNNGNMPNNASPATLSTTTNTTITGVSPNTSFFARAVMLPLELTGITRYVEARRKEEEFSKESKRYITAALNEMKFVSRFGNIMSANSNNKQINHNNRVGESLVSISVEEKKQFVLSLLDVLAKPFCDTILPILLVATGTSFGSTAPPHHQSVSEIEFDLVLSATSLAFRCFVLGNKNSFEQRIEQALRKSLPSSSSSKNANNKNNNNNNDIFFSLMNVSSSYSSSSSSVLLLTRRLKVTRVVFETARRDVVSMKTVCGLWADVFWFIAFLARSNLLEATSNSSTAASGENAKNKKQEEKNRSSTPPQNVRDGIIEASTSTSTTSNGFSAFFARIFQHSFFSSEQTSSSNSSSLPPPPLSTTALAAGTEPAMPLTLLSKSASDFSSSLNLLHQMLSQTTTSRSAGGENNPSTRNAVATSNSTKNTSSSLASVKLLTEQLQRHVFFDDIFEEIFSLQISMGNNDYSSTGSVNGGQNNNLLLAHAQIESCMTVCSAIFRQEIAPSTVAQQRSSSTSDNDYDDNDDVDADDAHGEQPSATSQRRHRHHLPVAALLTLLPLLSELLCQFSSSATRFVWETVWGGVSKLFVDLATTPPSAIFSSSSSLSLRALRRNVMEQLGDLVIHFLQTRTEADAFTFQKNFMQPFVTILMSAKSLDTIGESSSASSSISPTAFVRIAIVKQLERIVDRFCPVSDNNLPTTKSSSSSLNASSKPSTPLHPHQQQPNSSNTNLHSSSHHEERQQQHHHQSSIAKSGWEVILKGLSLVAQFEPEVVRECWPIVRKIVDRAGQFHSSSSASSTSSLVADVNRNQDHHHHHQVDDDQTVDDAVLTVARLRVQAASAFAASQCSSAIAKSSIQFTKSLIIINNNSSSGMEGEPDSLADTTTRFDQLSFAVSSFLSVILSPVVTREIKIASLCTSTEMMLWCWAKMSGSGNTPATIVGDCIHLIFDGFLVPLFSSKSYFESAESSSSSHIIAAVASAVALMSSVIKSSSSSVSSSLASLIISSCRKLIDLIGSQLNKCFTRQQQQQQSRLEYHERPHEHQLDFPVLLVWICDCFITRKLVSSSSSNVASVQKSEVTPSKVSRPSTKNQPSMRNVGTWAVSVLANILHQEEKQINNYSEDGNDGTESAFIITPPPRLQQHQHQQQPEPSEGEKLLMMALTSSSSSSKQQQHQHQQQDQLMESLTKLVLTMLSEAQVVGAQTLASVRHRFGTVNEAEEMTMTAKTVKDNVKNDIKGKPHHSNNTIAIDESDTPIRMTSEDDFVVVGATSKKTPLPPRRKDNDNDDDEADHQAEDESGRRNNNKNNSMKTFSAEENLEILIASFATSSRYFKQHLLKSTTLSSSFSFQQQQQDEVINSMFSIVDSWATRSRRSLNWIETAVAVRLSTILIKTLSSSSSSSNSHDQEEDNDSINSKRRSKFGLFILKWIVFMMTELQSRIEKVHNDDDDDDVNDVGRGKKKTRNATTTAAASKIASLRTKRRLSKALLLLVPLASRLLFLAFYTDFFRSILIGGIERRQQQQQQQQQSKKTIMDTSSGSSAAEFVSQVLKLVPLLPATAKASKVVAASSAFDSPSRMARMKRDMMTMTTKQQQFQADDDRDDDEDEDDDDDHHDDPSLMTVWNQFDFYSSSNNGSSSDDGQVDDENNDDDDDYDEYVATVDIRSPSSAIASVLSPHRNSSGHNQTLQKVFDADWLALNVSKFLTDYIYALI